MNNFLDYLKSNMDRFIVENESKIVILDRFKIQYG